MISYVIKLTGHCTLWSWWSWWSWFISHSFYSNSVDLPETRFPCCTVAPHPELAWSRRSSEHRHGIKKNVGTFTCLGGQSKVGEDPNTDEDKSQILIDSVRLFVCWKCSSTGWVVTGKAELVKAEHLFIDLVQFVGFTFRNPGNQQKLQNGVDVEFCGKNLLWSVARKNGSGVWTTLSPSFNKREMRKKKTRKLVLHFSRSIQSILYIGRTWQDGIAFETNYGSLLKTHSVSPFFRTF